MKEELKINQGGQPIALKEFGVQQSASVGGNPLALPDSLNIVYDQFIRDQKDLQTRSNDLLNSKKDKVTELNSAIAKLRNLISEKEQKSQSIAEKIKQKENEITDIRESRDSATGIVPFVIGVFIVILLTLYLFVFYSSTGYSAFYGVKPGSTSFINPNVFIEAQNKGGGVITMLVLFPVIFLGLGFLIHDALERKKYIFISMIIAFTFLVDALIGYKIAQNIYQVEYEKGLHQFEWDSSFIIKDINFYIILSLGFVVYLIWGTLLHYVLNKNKEISEPERIKSLKREISILEEEIQSLNQAIAQLKNEISDLEKDKALIQREIDDILSGKLIIDPNVLDSYVGQFMGGWLGFIELRFGQDPEVRTGMTKDTLLIKDQWFNLRTSKNN